MTQIVTRPETLKQYPYELLYPAFSLITVWKLAAGQENMFKANKHAWEYFMKQAPSYQKTIRHWIMNAKQETTQLSRLNKTIIASEKEKKLF